jgi:hypothetical protein
MKSHVFLTSLLAGAIGLCSLTAGERPRPFQADDLKEANQLREEKTDQLLAGVKGRLQKMLDVQIAVYDDTKGLHKVIQDTPNKKPRPEDQQASRKLAANEKDLVSEATKAIDVLEAEGVAVAFTEVFREVRKDMERLQLRLKISDVGMDTQTLEQEIIETLKDMISSFKKR